MINDRYHPRRYTLRVQTSTTVTNAYRPSPVGHLCTKNIPRLAATFENPKNVTRVRKTKKHTPSIATLPTPFNKQGHTRIDSATTDPT